MEASKIYWSEETVNYFKFISNYLNKEQTIKKIELFVEVDCTPQGDESEEDLIKDLTNIIYK